MIAEAQIIVGGERLSVPAADLLAALLGDDQATLDVVVEWLEHIKIITNSTTDNV